MRLFIALVVALFIILASTYVAALMPTNGAREGEELSARIERLREEIRERQVALRLSLAELAVNRGRR